MRPIRRTSGSGLGQRFDGFLSAGFRAVRAELLDKAKGLSLLPYSTLSALIGVHRRLLKNAYLVTDADRAACAAGGHHQLDNVFGPYLLWALEVWEATPSTRGPEWTHPWCTGCHASGIAG